MPERVQLTHHRTAKAELTEVFGDHIEFGAPVDEVIFPSELRNSRVVSADPYLNNLLIGYCEEALSHRKRKQGSFRSAVENAIAPLLPHHGRATAAEVARRLGLSQRTFARRLSSEGLTFSELLENMRSISPADTWWKATWASPKWPGCWAIVKSAPFACLPAMDGQNAARRVARGAVATALNNRTRLRCVCAPADKLLE